MPTVSRRQWLKGSAAVVGGFALPYLIPSGVLAAHGKPGPNDRVAIGVIGVGYRAKQLLGQMPEDGKVVALCDCNLPRANEYKAKNEFAGACYQDYRKILDRKDIDAVLVPTVEFQRVLPCIHACQAGKDVYAEKPLSLHIREGRILAQAVRKYDRILQVGTQQRSMAMNQVAAEFVRSGGLGKISEVNAINYPSLEYSKDDTYPKEKIPDGLSWGVWLNQVTWRPYNKTYIEHGWLKWRDFGGGEMTLWGAHGVDQIQWALGMDATGPMEIWPVGEGINAPVDMRYVNGVVVHFNIELGHGPHAGAIFVGQEGKLEINRNKFTSNPPEIAQELLKKVNAVEEEQKWSDRVSLFQAKGHLQNWLDCVRSRKKPAADVEIGHRSITACHLANIARDLRRRVKWDPVQEIFPDDEEADKLVNPPRRKGYELPATV